MLALLAASSPRNLSVTHLPQPRGPLHASSTLLPPRLGPWTRCEQIFAAIRRGVRPLHPATATGSPRNRPAAQRRSLASDQQRPSTAQHRRPRSTTLLDTTSCHDPWRPLATFWPLRVLGLPLAVAKPAQGICFSCAVLTGAQTVRQHRASTLSTTPTANLSTTSHLHAYSHLFVLRYCTALFTRPAS